MLRLGKVKEGRERGNVDKDKKYMVIEEKDVKEGKFARLEKKS